MDRSQHPWMSLGLVFFAMATLCYVVGLQFARVVEAPSPVATTPPSPELPTEQTQNVHTLVFVGDMMFGRYVEQLMDAQGARYPFEKIAPELTGISTLVGNLEGPIPVEHVPTPNNSTQFSFKPDTADLLREIGFDVVALGNNHGVDHGEDDYQNTRQVLARSGIASIGHPVRVEVDDYVSRFEDQVILQSFNMTFPFNEPQDAIDAVADLRAAHPSAVLIPQVHWGLEYNLESSPQQQELGRALIDAGATIVIGHHPHVTQEVERYKEGVIIYSLGNFIFDQYFSNDVQESLLATVRVTPKSVYVGLLPLVSVRSQPSIATGEQREMMMQAVQDRSPTVNTSLADATIELTRP